MRKVFAVLGLGLVWATIDFSINTAPTFAQFRGYQIIVGMALSAVLLYLVFPDKPVPVDHQVLRLKRRVEYLENQVEMASKANQQLSKERREARNIVQHLSDYAFGDINLSRALDLAYRNRGNSPAPRHYSGPDPQLA